MYICMYPGVSIQKETGGMLERNLLQVVFGQTPGAHMHTLRQRKLQLEGTWCQENSGSTCKLVVPDKVMPPRANLAHN